MKNFITNDYSKCLLTPVFTVPEYANLNKYQKEYLDKECMME